MEKVIRGKGARTDWGEMTLVVICLGVGFYSLAEVIFGNVLLDFLAAFIGVLTLTKFTYRQAKLSQERQK